MLNNDGVEDVDFTGNFSEEQLNRYIQGIDTSNVNDVEPWADNLDVPPAKW
jgi:hypothetical protein